MVFFKHNRLNHGDFGLVESRKKHAELRWHCVVHEERRPFFNLDQRFGGTWHNRLDLARSYFREGNRQGVVGVDLYQGRRAFTELLRSLCGQVGQDKLAVGIFVEDVGTREHETYFRNPEVYPLRALPLYVARRPNQPPRQISEN